MSFGYSVGDFVLLTQLAWTVVDNSRKACGEHDELAREVNNLYVVLRRLSEEVSKPDSLLSVSNDDRLDELRNIARDCRRLLKALDKQLAKYNALTGEKRSFTKMWQQVRFGNGMMKSLNDVRLKASSYTSALTLYINLLSIGSQGRIERHMYAQGGDLREMRHSINWITATMQASHTEGSILTSYSDDDKAVWKQLRRELIKKGFSCSVLRKNKDVIKKYLLELSKRGVLDERLSGESALGHGMSEASGISGLEPNLSGSEQVLRRPSLVTSVVLEGDIHAEASGSNGSAKGKGRDCTKDTQASAIQEISKHEPAAPSTMNNSDTEAKKNVEYPDSYVKNTLLSETPYSITSLTSCNEQVLKPTIIEEIQDIEFPDGAHPNCEMPFAPSPEVNPAKGKFIPKGKDEEVPESSSEVSEEETQRVTALGDSSLMSDINLEESDVEEPSKSTHSTYLEVFSRVVDLDDGSEYPTTTTTTYLLHPSTPPRAPPKKVGSEWFQWCGHGSVWRILEVDQYPPKQTTPARSPTGRPILPRVVVIQAEQKKILDGRKNKNHNANGPNSEFYDTKTEPHDSHSELPQTKSGTPSPASYHLGPPPSPEATTFVVGNSRGRSRALHYPNCRRMKSVYPSRRGTGSMAYPPRRRTGAIYYANTKLPRTVWRPHISYADEVEQFEEGEWVNDSEGPCVIEVTYISESESGPGFSRSQSRSEPLPRAATVVVVDTRAGRGYYPRSRIARSKSASSRIDRSRIARSRSASTVHVYEYERTVYHYERGRTGSVYEYDGRANAIYFARSRPRPSRWLSGYHPASTYPPRRRSIVARRRIIRTTTF